MSSFPGEFRQKASELDDKLTCSKPIRKPLLTQVWDKMLDPWLSCSSSMVKEMLGSMLFKVL